MHAVAELMLEGGADQVRISLRNIVLDVAERCGRQSDRSVRSGQRSCIVHRGRNAADAAGVNAIHDLIVRRIEKHVISHVAEIALVADAVAAAEGCFAVAENIPREADARGEIMPARLPQLADRTVGSGIDLAFGDGYKLIRSLVAG